MCGHRHLHATNAEAGPHGVGGQVVDHGFHGGGIGRRAPGNAQAQLEQRVIEQPFLDHLLGEPQVAGVEDFQLGLYAQFLDTFGAGTQLRRGGHVNGVAIAEVQRAAVQGADFRQQLFNVGQAGQRADQVGIGPELHGVLAATDLQVAAHAGGEVDDDVDVGLADALHHFAVQGHIAAELAGLWVAYMAMHHGGAGLGGLYRGGGDLFRGDRHVRASGGRVASTGECAGDDDVVVHEAVPYRRVISRRRVPFATVRGCEAVIWVGYLVVNCRLAAAGLPSKVVTPSSQRAWSCG